MQADYGIPRNHTLRARGFNVDYGALRRRWGVPLWSQAQSVGAISAAATSIALDVDPYEYRDASLALVYQSVDVFAVVEITTVGADILNLSAAVGTTFTAAKVMPMRVGFVRGNISHQRTGFEDFGKVLFDIEDNAELTVSAPTQFLSNDIYFDQLLKGDDAYEASLQAKEELADFSIGAIDRLSPWNFTRHLQSVQMLFETPTEVHAFRLWLHRRAGKYRSFWTPSFENDLRVANVGTIVSTLQWTRDSYDDWATDHTHVAIEDTSGNWYARTLSAVSVVNPTTLQGTLSSAINIPATSVQRISYLGLKRLASDSIKLEWIGGGVSRCSFGVLEVQP
jgi:hypothetical protein